jgi:hypothetical protein
MPVLCEGTRRMTSAARDCTSEREEKCFDSRLMSDMGISTVKPDAFKDPLLGGAS